jgi:hypothetical protein
VEIPEETVRLARAVFPKGCPVMRVRDALGPVFSDADFEDLFPVRGRPAVSPARLALVSVLQFAEGLNDRQAAHAVRSRLDWKYALSLELRPSQHSAPLDEIQRGGIDQQRPSWRDGPFGQLLVRPTRMNSLYLNDLPMAWGSGNE